MTPEGTYAPGELFAGRFRIERIIGRGGFGVVYQAIQLPMERRIALKVLLPAALGMDQGYARFRREAELAQRLEHPHTVRLYDFGTSDEGAPFIAWELLTGEGLDERLKRAGPMTIAQTVHVGRQVLKSLMDAHEKGIVHRDIKPSNLFLCRYSGDEDFVKVLDFGIAKSTLASAGAPMTEVGRTIGTPRYMSPEQAHGRPVGPPSDLYSLGLVLAETMTGRSVMERSSVAELLLAIASPDPIELPAIVRLSPIGPVIERATRKAPELRTRTAGAMLAELDQVAESVRAASGSFGAMATPSDMTPMGMTPMGMTPMGTMPIGATPMGLTPRSGPMAAAAKGAGTTTGAGWRVGAMIAALAVLGIGVWYVAAGDAVGPSEKRERRNERDGDRDRDPVERDKETEEDAPEDEPTRPEVAVVGPVFRGVRPTELRSRIERAGAEVLKQHATERHTYWIVRTAEGEGTIDVERHANGARATQAEAMLQRIPGVAFVREGETLLSVQHSAAGEAERILKSIAP